MNLKKMITSIALSGLFFAGKAQGQQNTSNCNYDCGNNVNSINVQQLKDLYNDCRGLIVVDARIQDCDNGQRLPEAISIPYNTCDKDLEDLLPCKNSIIVIYSTNADSPDAFLLAERLMKLSYTAVYVYCEGLDGWLSKQLPIDHAR